MISQCQPTAALSGEAHQTTEPAVTSLFPYASEVEGARRGSNQARPTSNLPLQLVEVSSLPGGNWHFQINEQALKMLESYGQRQVAVCTVCGPYRSGKSYLLNRLRSNPCERAAQFGVGSTTRACTEGLWIWTAAEEGESMQDEPALLFMDCEGFGNTDANSTRDAKLMALCMLVSSIFVLNTRGVLSEGLFNSLSLVSRFAKHIEDPQQLTSKPLLLWVLRDFVLDLCDATGRQITSDEYLERALQAQPLAGADAARSHAAKDVRESILTFFPQRHCRTLVQPVVEEEQLQQLPDVSDALLRPAFLEQVQQLRAQVKAAALERPKMVAGQPIGGASLAAMLRSLVESLNSDRVLSVMSAWDGVQHTACAALVEELRELISKHFVEQRSSLPLEDRQLRKFVQEQQTMMEREWQRRAVGDQIVQEEYWQDLCFSLSQEEETLTSQNKRLAKAQTSSIAKGQQEPGGKLRKQAPEVQRAKCLCFNTHRRGSGDTPQGTTAVKAPQRPAPRGLSSLLWRSR